MPKKILPLPACIQALKFYDYSQFRDNFKHLNKEDGLENLEGIVKVLGGDAKKHFLSFKRMLDVEGGRYPEVTKKAVDVFVNWMEGVLSHHIPTKLISDLSQLLGERYFTVHKTFFDDVGTKSTKFNLSKLDKKIHTDEGEYFKLIPKCDRWVKKYTTANGEVLMIRILHSYDLDYALTGGYAGKIDSDKGNVRTEMDEIVEKGSKSFTTTPLFQLTYDSYKNGTKKTIVKTHIGNKRRREDEDNEFQPSNKKMR